MGFVNEFVSEEDIKKYKLDEIWLKNSPAYKSVPASFRHHWTIDRERDIYFKVIGSGREELANQVIGNFYWKGQLLTVHLYVAAGGSLKFSEQPFRKIWERADIFPRQAVTEHPEIMDALKEALTVYGVRGMQNQVPNTIVEFKF